MEVFDVLPEKLPPVNRAAPAQVEQVHGHQVPVLVEPEDIHVLAAGGGHFLPLAELFDGPDQVAVAPGLLVLLSLGAAYHALVEVAYQVAFPALEKPANVSHRLGVAGRRRQPVDARALAALDIKLKTSARVVAGQVHR